MFDMYGEHGVYEVYVFKRRMLLTWMRRELGSEQSIDCILQTSRLADYLPSVERQTYRHRQTDRQTDRHMVRRPPYSILELAGHTIRLAEIWTEQADWRLLDQFASYLSVGQFLCQLIHFVFNHSSELEFPT